MAEIKEITAKNFESLLQKSHYFPVAVIVVADGCPYCEAAKPRFAAFANRWQAGRVGFVKDDRFPELIKNYKIEAFPSYLLFKEGKAVRKAEGMLEPRDLAGFASV